MKPKDLKNLQTFLKENPSISLDEALNNFKDFPRDTVVYYHQKLVSNDGDKNEAKNKTSEPKTKDKKPSSVFFNEMCSYCYNNPDFTNESLYKAFPDAEKSTVRGNKTKIIRDFIPLLKIIKESPGKSIDEYMEDAKDLEIKGFIPRKKYIKIALELTQSSSEENNETEKNNDDILDRIRGKNSPKHKRADESKEKEKTTSKNDSKNNNFVSRGEFERLKKEVLDIKKKINSLVKEKNIQPVDVEPSDEIDKLIELKKLEIESKKLDLITRL